MSAQIAALTYRAGAAGDVEILLITSRDTGRWVVPKGNPMPGLAGHEAAAQEAWEEAGVRGAICPTPLGRFRYRKRRRLGGTRTMTVTVYPMLVIEQAGDWPERHQRVTQWFDVRDAAAAVAEPELKDLIAGFEEPPRRDLIDRVLPDLRTTIRRRVPMLGWFQSLLPKQGRFFEQFEAHGATLTAGAGSLARLLGKEGDAAAHVAAIVDQEHRADDITRDVLHEVRRTFITPFDRSAIIGLIGVMDDAIDEMNGFATATSVYDVTDFTAEMRDMGGVIVEAARVTVEALPLLRSINGNAARINELTARIVELEGSADRIHDDGLKALYLSADGDALRFVVGRELYNILERVVDRFEDVANAIQGLVIDHA